MMISLSMHVFVPRPLKPRFFHLVREAGFKAVEIWAMTPHVEIEEEGKLAEAVKWAREAGLKTPSLHLPFYRRWGAPDFRFLGLGDPQRDFAKLASDLILRVLDKCPDLGVPVAVLHGMGYAPGDEDYLRDLYARDLEPVVERAEKLGVTLAVENIMSDLSKSAEIAALVDKVKSPNLKACLDTGHANVNENVKDAVDNLGSLIAATHLQDNHGTTDEHLIPGQGTIDWQYAAKAIKACGDPLLTVEINGPDSGREFDEKSFAMHLKKAYDSAVNYFG